MIEETAMKLTFTKRSTLCQNKRGVIIRSFVFMPVSNIEHGIWIPDLLNTSMLALQSGRDSDLVVGTQQIKLRFRR